VQITKKIVFNQALGVNFYNISPRRDVSKMVLKTVVLNFLGNKYIILATAASVVISFPEITPTAFSSVLVA